MDMAVPCLYYGVPLISHRMRKFDPDAAHALTATTITTAATTAPMTVDQIAMGRAPVVMARSLRAALQRRVAPRPEAATV